MCSVCAESPTRPLWAIVALGSNQGDPERHVMEAMHCLRRFAAGEWRQSSLWRSAPVDCPPDSPEFVNAVVAFHPAADEQPESLLAKLQTLELQFGRLPKRVFNEPRPLDLDLIAFGAEERQSPALILPHPRATEREFVLGPLAEILPDWQFPGDSRTVAALLAGLAERERGFKRAGKKSSGRE